MSTDHDGGERGARLPSVNTPHDPDAAPDAAARNHGDDEMPDAVAARLEREAAFHDQTAEDDTRRPAEKFYAVTRRSQAFFLGEIVREVKGQRVLDYGCGTGGNTCAVARHGALVTGIDISPGAIAVAQSKVDAAGVGDHVELRVMNAEALELSADTFDKVFGSSILHHLDLDACYREIHRVLRPGGVAIFDEPLGHNPLINWYRNRTPSMRTLDEHPMLVEEIERARRTFSRVDVRYYHIASLAVVPLRDTPLFTPAYVLTEALDRALMTLIPPLRRWAWRAIVVLRK